MQFTFKAEPREAQSTGASRRLRKSGRVPAVVYGGKNEAQPIDLDHNEIYHLLRKEAFHSSVLNIEISGKKEIVILRDTQWHPFRQQVLHLDFQRIDASQKLHMKVPLHFINADVCPGVKIDGGIVSHVMNEIDVKCLPGKLPAFIEVDLKDLTSAHSFHVSQLALPEGVEVVAHGDSDPVVATVLKAKGSDTTDEASAAAAAPAAPAA